MPLQAVFFDLYGTLARFYPPREVIQARAAERFGMSLTPDGVNAGYHLADAFMSEQNATAPVNRLSYAEREAFFAHFERLVLKGAGYDVDLDTARAIWHLVRRQEYALTLFEDVVPSLRRLRHAGLITGLISNMDERGEELAGRLGLSGHVDVAVTSLDAGGQKPHAPIFLMALGRAGVEAKQAAHVGDQPGSDLDGARAVGIRPILMDRYGGHKDYSRDPRVESMAGVEAVLSTL